MTDAVCGWRDFYQFSAYRGSRRARRRGRLAATKVVRRQILPRGPGPIAVDDYLDNLLAVSERTTTVTFIRGQHRGCPPPLRASERLESVPQPQSLAHIAIPGHSQLGGDIS